MKKISRNKRERDMLDEYDFRQGVRGKYAKRYAEGQNIVVISPELAKIFPNSAAVNEALRALVALARKSTRKR
jgi:hypothetical protein